MYIDTTTQEWGLTQAEIMQRHPMTVFPEPFAPLEQYAKVVDQPQPACNAETHKLIEAKPKLINGEWQQQWRKVALTESELEQRVAEQAAAEQAAKDAARITVTKRQVLLALFLRKGIKADQIDAVINAIPDETQRYMARVDWDGAAAIESDSQTVGMLSQALGLTEAEMPDLFDFAQAL
ncbi:hypothetical protein HNP33_002084 [Comamonas odontotermitis]|uniref:Uncharacterized protein n=1 Tax=Comamonas odontotermitis TaxID=379895 RepID=A0ABR6RFS7_9BURK|nr:hypothetical protein [Comamonas odontotermitis]MBB6578016.1 hypothetical protein [Comamonas odontotermitis]